MPCALNCGVKGGRKELCEVEQGASLVALFNRCYLGD